MSAVVRMGRVMVRGALAVALIASSLLPVTAARAADDYPAAYSTTGYVAPGASITGEIEIIRDSDWIRTHFTEGGVYRIQVTGTNGGGGTIPGPMFTFVGGGGELFGDSTGSYSGIGTLAKEAVFTHAAKYTGDYYIKVRSYLSSGVGTYTVSVSVVSDAPVQPMPGPGPTASPAPSTPPKVDFFPLPTTPGSTRAQYLAAGPDGAIWFMKDLGRVVGRMTTSGALTQYTLPGPSALIYELVAGPDGALWYADESYNQIRRIAPSGTTTTYPVAQGVTGRALAFDLDGNAWFRTNTNIKPGSGMAKISTAGVVTNVSLAVPESFGPSSMVLGFGGYMWGGDSGTVHRVGMDGYVAHYMISPDFGSHRYAYGYDGNLWFVDGNGYSSSTSIGKIDPAGKMTVATVPSTGYRKIITAITAGSDGAMWFAYTDQIGRITSDGEVTLYPLPAGAAADYIVSGSDGNLWFADTQNPRIGRMTLTQAVRLPAPKPTVLTATAAQTPLRVGATFSSAQAASQSYLRFFNTGAAAGTAKITLSNATTGASLGQWTSSSIPAGAEVQFGIGTIETDLKVGAAKPAYYSLAIDSSVSGYFQHVLFRPSDGTLTNLSTCGSGVTADAKSLSGVHTSLLQAGFPSTVVVNNTGANATTVTLGIYDARNGTRLGAYTTAAIPAGGQLLLPAATFELTAGAPAAGMYHYVVKAEGAFTGFLQHLVSNIQAGVTTDMTTACSLSGTATPTVASPLRLGATFSSSQAESQSFLRFFNTGTAAGTAKITLSNFTTGAALGQWTSASIPAGAEVQFGIGSIESDLGITANKPAYYSLSIQAGVSGYFQHVLFRPSDGTLTNLSTCGAGITADAKSLSGVHTSLLQAGFPSTVVVNNTGANATTVTLGIFDARNGTRLGAYTTAAIPAGGQLMLPANTFETVAGTPTAGMYHYVVKAEGTFTGFLQHLVNNIQAGVTTDMTTACAL